MEAAGLNAEIQQLQAACANCGHQYCGKEKHESCEKFDHGDTGDVETYYKCSCEDPPGPPGPPGPPPNVYGDDDLEDDCIYRYQCCQCHTTAKE